MLPLLSFVVASWLCKGASPGQAWAGLPTRMAPAARARAAGTNTAPVAWMLRGSWPKEPEERGPRWGGPRPSRAALRPSRPRAQTTARSSPSTAVVVGRTRSESGPSTATVGGARIEASLTAVVAGISVGLLCAFGQVTQAGLGLPLWAPPLGACSLIFASEATAAAREGKIMAPSAIWQRALKAGSAVAGACALSILMTRLFGASPLGRAAAVTIASLWMVAFPTSGYFPPTGAFCALYVDQAMAQGALAKLGLLYALFPSGVGTVLLIVLTRALAGAAVGPLRALERAKQAQRAEAVCA